MLVCLYVHMSHLLQSPGLRDLLFYLFQRHRTHQELSSPCWWRVGGVRSGYHIRVSLGVQCWGWLTGRWYPETQDHTINQSLISDTPGSPDVRDFSEREKQYQIIVKNRSLMQLIALIRLNIATDCLQHCSAQWLECSMFCIGMICMKWLKTFQSIILQLFQFNSYSSVSDPCHQEGSHWKGFGRKFICQFNTFQTKSWWYSSFLVEHLSIKILSHIHQYYQKQKLPCWRIFIRLGAAPCMRCLVDGKHEIFDTPVSDCFIY